jgi:hypothetical protein
MAKLPTAGQVTFHADSLSDLASFFDQQASNAIEALQRKLPIREEAQYKGQVYAWREAATIVERPSEAAACYRERDQQDRCSRSSARGSGQGRRSGT